MKIKLSSPKEKKLRATRYPRAFERQFSEFNRAMVEAITKQYRNNTLKKLTKADVSKFADKKIGNYAEVFNKLSRDAKRRITKRFNNDRLDSFVKEFMQGIDVANAKDIYGAVESSIGIDQAVLAKSERLKPSFNALVQETSNWVKKLRDDVLEDFSAVTLRNMALGKSLEEILVEFDILAEKKDGVANSMARTQVSTYNSLSTKFRAQNLGISEAIWKTSQDRRVRKSHADRNNKKFDLAKGLYSSVDKKWLLPGVDYNCRCTYIMIIPEE